MAVEIFAEVGRTVYKLCKYLLLITLLARKELITSDITLPEDEMFTHRRANLETGRCPLYCEVTTFLFSDEEAKINHIHSKI